MNFSEFINHFPQLNVLQEVAPPELTTSHNYPPAQAISQAINSLRQNQTGRFQAINFPTLPDFHIEGNVNDGGGFLSFVKSDLQVVVDFNSRQQIEIMHTIRQSPEKIWQASWRPGLAWTLVLMGSTNPIEDRCYFEPTLPPRLRYRSILSESQNLDIVVQPGHFGVRQSLLPSDRFAYGILSLSDADSTRLTQPYSDPADIITLATNMTTIFTNSEPLQPLHHQGLIFKARSFLSDSGFGSNYLPPGAVPIDTPMYIDGAVYPRPTNRPTILRINDTVMIDPTGNSINNWRLHPEGHPSIAFQTIDGVPATFIK